jgi:hypothetical protein
MSNPLDCCNNCDTPETVNVPGVQGDDGTAGTDGTDGVNAYTQTTADFTIPAVSANVTVQVGNSTWMAAEQNIFIAGAGTFEVVSKPTTTSVTLTYLDYDANTGSGNNIATGAVVSPGGFQLTSTLAVADGGTGSVTATLARAALGIGGASLTAYASGTAYQFTNTAALLNFGTTDPSLTITSAGTWLLIARVRVDYTGATFAAVRAGTLKLRRTNNTAADLANSVSGFNTDIITTLTYTLGSFNLPPIIYVTTNANDVIELWGSIAVVPTAGSLDASEAEIVAIKLFDQTI